MTAWTFETTVDPDVVRSEDGGTHLVAYGLGDGECPLYVHLLSEEDAPEAEGAHGELRSLVGQRVRVTIELVPESRELPPWDEATDAECDEILRGDGL